MTEVSRSARSCRLIRFSTIGSRFALTQLPFAHYDQLATELAPQECRLYWAQKKLDRRDPGGPALLYQRLSARLIILYARRNAAGL